MPDLGTHRSVMLVGQPEPRPGFSDVYDAYVDFVWSMVRRLGVPAAQLEDAVQDVFVVVHRQLPGFRGASTVKTWVGGIAVRVAHEYRRRARRGGETEPLEQHVDVPATGGDPQHAAEAAQAWARLEKLLDTLDDDQRTVFVLAHLEELSAPEIAEVVRAPVNTVYSRLRLARTKLQDALTSLRGGVA